MSSYYIYCKKADFQRISEQFHISPILARILRNRDIVSDEEIEDYLNGGTDSLNDPFLMKGIKEAVPLIFDTLKNNRKIRIIGDYDSDGVCSSYILLRYLSFLGAKADIRLPDRMAEGYGMNSEMVREALEDQVGLIITCDNGVSSYDAVSAAKEAGIKVIVSDHHEVPLPLVEADVLIDPKQPGDEYPYKELCGAGVAYKIISAIHQVIQYDPANIRKDIPAFSGFPSDAALISASENLLEEMLQFAAIATIADVVPLNGENRILAGEGLKGLRCTENQGLLSLLRERGIDPEQLSSYHVGFVIAPCINSAGRLKNAEIALSLLDASGEEAAAIAQELSELNEERKKMTEIQTENALQIVDSMLESEGILPKILVIYLPDSHESIAGIVAGRLKEFYERPAIVITKSQDGYKGSGRSVSAYNMIEALRRKEELFSKLGGHAKAAGFSLAEGVTPDELAKQLEQDCPLKEEDLFEKKWIDMTLPFAYATEDLVEELKVLEPFGLANERPVFAQKNIRANRAVVFGKNNNVLRLSLEDEQGIRKEAVYFASDKKVSEIFQKLASGKEREGDAYRISLVFYPALNEFRGQRTVQLKIIDFINL